MAELPKVTYGGKVYYADRHLGEFRNVENPHDAVWVGSDLGFEIMKAHVEQNPEIVREES